MNMREVSFDEYLRFVEENNEIIIEDQVISLKPIIISRLEPRAKELTDVSTTVWSFPKRGSWATHRGDYRGNWAPQIPRALILMYTKRGDTVLDQMIGSGTTCIEARLLGRNCVGVDINYNSIMLTLHRLYYLVKYAKEAKEKKLRQDNMDLDSEAILNILGSWSKIFHGDARNLDKIEDESIDLIATHPPYFNIIRYGRREAVEGDLSRTRRLEEYLRWMKQVAKESYRVLKPGHYCAVLIGDTRIRRHYVPLSHYVLDVFLDVGFILKEEVIKIQHKMKTTREIWRKTARRNFLLIYHEKLFIFRKPYDDERIRDTKYSRKPNFLNLKL